MIAANTATEEERTIRHHGDARAWCRGLSMAGAPLPTSFRVTDGLEVTIAVPHRDSGSPVDIRFTFPTPRFPISLAEWEAYVTARVVSVWAHEALEWLRRDGERVYDPHLEPVERLALVGVTA